MSEFFDAADGRRIAYAVSGEGPAIFCLPGISRTMVDYADLARHLAPRHQVIRMDYRGRGASGWAENPVAEYTPIVEGQDMMALAAHLGIERGTIVGTSRGGIIGMLLAAGQPHFVSGLVLNDIGAVVERAGLEFIMTYIGLDPGLADFETAAARMKTNFSAAFPGLTEADWMAFARRTYRDDGGRPALAYDPDLREATAVALENSPPDLWKLFDAVQAPILTLRGEHSNILSAGTLAEMARRRPDMTHLTIADRGHVPFLDEPEALSAIDRFLLEVHA
ncbi:MAG: alpha/beta hydrolase [Paracoccaceae bacterium]|nr:alpha/beta hydrolase [Paracoccaceae bacterium]